MVKYSDVIVGYSTYPHIDIRNWIKVDLIIEKNKKKLLTLCIKLTFQFSHKHSRWISTGAMKN